MTGITRLALRLVEEYAHDLRRAFTISQLAKATGKPYPNVHATVKRLLADGVLTREIVGHAHNCRLDLTSPAAGLYLALVQAQKPQAPLPPGAEHAVLAWKRDTDYLLVTREPRDGAITLREFLADKELFATIGKHTLLKGHALYAHLIAEAGR